LEVTSKKKNIAIIQMISCSALWSVAGILIKNVPWNPLVIAGARSMIVAVALFIYLKVTKTPIVISKQTILTGVFSSLTCVSFVAANKLTTAANAIVLQFTAPVFIMLFSVMFFKRRFFSIDIATAIFTLIGISLFFFEQLTPGKTLGDIIAILAGVFMAWMYILIGEISPEKRLSALFIAQFITIVIAAPFFIYAPPVMEVKPVVCILLLGVVQQAIPYVLYAKASEYCPPLACSLLGALEPLLNPVWVFLFDGETPGIFALIGGAIVILTVTFWCLRGNKTEQVNSAV